MELNEFEILKRQAGASDHTGSVSRASVGTRAGEVGSSVTSGSENRLVRAEAMHRSILLVVGHHSDALAVLHDEICVVGGNVSRCPPRPRMSCDEPVAKYSMKYSVL